MYTKENAGHMTLEEILKFEPISEKEAETQEQNYD